MLPEQLTLKAEIPPSTEIRWELSSGAAGVIEDYGQLVELMDLLGDQRWELTDASAELVGPRIQLGLVAEVQPASLHFSFRRGDTRREYRHVSAYTVREGAGWALRYAIGKGGDGQDSADGPEDYAFVQNLAARWKPDGWELIQTLDLSSAGRRNTARLFFFMRPTGDSLEERTKWRKVDQEISLHCRTVGCPEMRRTVQRELSSLAILHLKDQTHRRLCPACLLPMDYRLGKVII